MEAITIPGAFSDLTEAHNTTSNHDEDGTTSVLPPKSVLMNISLAASESPVQLDITKEQKGVGHRTIGDEPEVNDEHVPRLRSSRIWKTRESDLLNGKSPRKPLSLLDLPIDVVSLILPHCNPSALVTLAQTCKMMKKLVTSVLYTNLDLGSRGTLLPGACGHACPIHHVRELESAIQFLLRNPASARLVRKFKLTI